MACEFVCGSCGRKGLAADLPGGSVALPEGWVHIQSLDVMCIDCLDGKEGKTDLVDLVFITPHNHMFANSLTRACASNIIQDWYRWRDAIFTGSDKAREAGRWLEAGTFAINVTKDGRQYTQWSIGWEHVIGLYIREREVPPISEVEMKERSVKAAETVAECLKKDLENRQEGDEWKKGED